MTVGSGGRVRMGDGEGLSAITSYFNPLGSRRRRENVRVFRERLNRVAGAWRWKSLGPEMRECVASHFVTRKRDA